MVAKLDRMDYYLTPEQRAQYEVLERAADRLRKARKDGERILRERLRKELELLEEEARIELRIFMKNAPDQPKVKTATAKRAMGTKNHATFQDWMGK